MARNKVIYNGETLIDLTGDTVEADKVLAGYTFHKRDGSVDEGECTFDSDTSDATAAASEILATKTAYVGGSKVIGSMNNRGSWSETIDDKDDEISIPVGFHDGSGSIKLAAAEKLKLIAANIKAGIVLLGITGTYTGESVNAQAKSATPSASQQVITPDSGYDYLSQVTIAAIPYTETLNSAGGYTVTIG